MIINPDKEIGILQYDANIGATEIYANADTFNYSGLSRGIEIRLDDGTNAENIGRIIGYDIDTRKIVFEKPLTQNFTLGAKICLNNCIVKDAFIDNALIPYNINIGGKGSLSNYLTANTVFRVVWKNNGGQSKDICFSMEYNYL